MDINFCADFISDKICTESPKMGRGLTYVLTEIENLFEDFDDVTDDMEESEIIKTSTENPKVIPEISKNENNNHMTIMVDENDGKPYDLTVPAQGKVPLLSTKTMLINFFLRIDVKFIKNLYLFKIILNF